MLRFLATVFFMVSLFIFFSVYISPEFFPYIGLISLGIPVVLLLNLAFFILLIAAKRKLALLPLLTLIIGWKFVTITFQWRDRAGEMEGLSILSYNVFHFNYIKEGQDPKEVNQNLMRWLKDNPSDIKCLQEFYQDYTTPSRNAIKQLGKEVGYEFSYQPMDGNPSKRSNGLVIFSKYPIINEGKVFGNQRNNGVIFADIKVDKDTIRVYNAHLESMSIPSEQLNNIEGIKSNYKITLKKIMQGQLSRASQLRILEEHMQNSPYVNILVGDFNDVPYSYAYFTLKKFMENAFEKAGRGFGFTYNKVLFFIRIDNIFFENPLQAKIFKTHKEVDYSDHYPVSAVFTWESPLSKLPKEEEF